MKKQITYVLDRVGIAHHSIKHEPVHTVADVAKYLPDEYPVKNLLLTEEKGERCIFVVMKGDERLDTKQLAVDIGCKKLQFAKPDVLMEKLGVEPGSASLFSLLHPGSVDVEVVIDKRLLAQPKLGFHPSINTETIIIGGSDITLFLDGISRAFRVLSF